MDQTTYYRTYVQDCLAEAELHEYFKRQFHSAGYAGCTFRRSFRTVDITIRVAEPALVYGENHELIHQVESVLAQRLNLPLNAVTLYCDKIIYRGLSADVLANIVQEKIEKQVPVRQAAMFVIRSAMRNKAGGCEVRVAGKLRQQRANAQKYHEGVIISAGKPGKDFIDRAVRHIPLKQGIIGVQVKIFNPQTKNQFGHQLQLPDHVEVFEHALHAGRSGQRPRQERTHTDYQERQERREHQNRGQKQPGSQKTQNRKE